MSAGSGLLSKAGIPQQVVPVTPSNTDTDDLNAVGLRTTGAGLVVFEDGSGTARAVGMGANDEIMVRVRRVLASATIDGSTQTTAATGIHAFRFDVPRTTT